MRAAKELMWQRLCWLQFIFISLCLGRGAQIALGGQASYAERWPAAVSVAGLMFAPALWC